MLKNRIITGSKISHNGCWVWSGWKNSNGYGELSVNGKRHIKAHRLSYSEFIGDPSGYFVCHTCDNPSCVNPDHLFLGTPKDNSMDMASKGRSIHGIKHHGAKLDEIQVMTIKTLLIDGLRQHDIGDYFGVSGSVISRIKTGKIWTRI